MIEKISTFILKYSTYTNKEVIEEYIKRHLEYGTAEVLFDDEGEVIAVVRWNITGVTAEVCDLIIHPDYRGNDKIMIYFLQRGLKKFPYMKFLMFKRGYDNATIEEEDKKPWHRISIDRWLKRKGL